MSLNYQCFYTDFYPENTNVSDSINVGNMSIFKKLKIKIILIVFHALL